MGYFDITQSLEKTRRKTIDSHTGKYPRKPKMEEGKLEVWFGKLSKHEDPDFCVISGVGAGGSSTRRFALSFICGPHPHVGGGSGWLTQTFVEEMDARGFDISTLRFSIRKKR